jgi:proton-coupled amino acid transporter
MMPLPLFCFCTAWPRTGVDRTWPTTTDPGGSGLSSFQPLTLSPFSTSNWRHIAFRSVTTLVDQFTLSRSMAFPRQVPGTGAGAGAGDSKQPRQSAAPSQSTASPHPTDPSPAQVGTPPAIPNIPPRAVSGSSVAPRSFSTSLKQGSLVRDAISRGMAASPSQPASRPSIDNLGSKLSPTPGNSASALTAALGGSPAPASGPGQPSSSEAEPLSRKGSLSPLVRPANSRGESGASTPRPGDSSFSNIAGIPDEQKAKVLRRHLVSAEERGGSSSKDNTPAGPSPGDASPTDEHGDYAMQGGGSAATPAGESGVSYGATSSRSRAEDEQFPIPYDAPGGDVT